MAVIPVPVASGSAAAAARTRADACPGALRPHLAADGALLRLRLPGGILPGPALRALAEASARFADGGVGLTSRGNVQLRGVAEADVAALTGPLQAAGLLPSATHERVRNIVAGPFADEALVAALDRELCARAGLADLPGRFLFAVDLPGERADVVIETGRGVVRVAGGPALETTDPVGTAIGVAEAFVAERAAQGSQAWRISELGVRRVLARLTTRSTTAPAAPSVSAPVPGVLAQPDGRLAVCALVPFGVLDQAQVAALVATGAPLRVTPWRRIVVRDLAAGRAAAVRKDLAAAGLVVEPSAWARVTACTGRPGCSKARADVRADARAFVEIAGPAGPAVHWAGCERGCGTPSGGPGDVVKVVATGRGYDVEGVLCAAEHRRVLRAGAV